MVVKENLWITGQESNWRGLEHQKVTERSIKSPNPSYTRGSPASQKSGQEVDRRKLRVKVIDSAVLDWKKNLRVKSQEANGWKLNSQNRQKRWCQKWNNQQSSSSSSSGGYSATQESNQKVKWIKCRTEVIDSAILAGKKDLWSKNKKFKWKY